MTEPVLASTADGLTTVTVNRPEALNALNTPVKEALLAALTAAASDPACRAVLLTGAGERAFCVGQDLREHVENLRGDDPLATVRDHFNPIAAALFNMPKPVVAAVRGAAAGAGASLAFLADFRIGGPSTGFTMAFAGIGLAADTGASYTLPRLVGPAVAAEMLMLNRKVAAERALQLGLLTELVDTDDDVLPRATALATELAAGPTVCFAQMKRQLRQNGDFDTALTTEAEAQAACGFTADHAGAVDAFVNKRRPTFEGR
ncbi:2-(1,2-epoxy-1,2-dihydrophenyl)acetyl-CoA isomerase [Stackebrandtia endophytica]|uniref:2-(1,2-epoxy-1,2-dihydrophenyl)acetyl-CoA isomerase n=1 Tax=Stackebrandtia endophytica TaxID=1496996 RepID=A0A543AU71_9ACTN|nr:enoyl-CoA hydratase-related protein [Stackebrandtia endophytica]TQL76133.1 2-(1,2-epoxy-1,2-dihydrophenyl)acetyl-CoA isomerase [Stackebrandtia endophytica]